MAKKSAIGTRVPFWFKLRSIAEPIKIKNNDLSFCSSDQKKDSEMISDPSFW